MPMFEHPREVIRFGDFELDPTTGELTCAGSSIRLQPQPLKVLLCLIRNRGGLVTREQLKQEIMQDSPYGDADHAINLAVAKLRTALRDSSDKPQFIDTLPRRGYRFLARVQIPAAQGGVPLERSPALGRRKLRGIIAAVLLIIFALAIILAVRRNSARLGNQETVVVAAFTNNTGDPVFDNTLRQGVSAQLRQSPSVNVLSDQRISQVLSLMMQPRGTQLTSELAREVCQRTASAATIDGSIATLGNQYVLELKAVNCRSGDLLAHEQVAASSKEQVLKSLSEAAAKLREQLRVLLPSLPERPALEYVTTPSAEALQAYSLGCHAMAVSRDDSAAIPLFERATRLDPKFAMAYAQLGILYKNIGQSARAAETIRKAYALREQVGEREKLYIEAHYEHTVTGNLEAARKKYLLWAHIYPDNAVPLVNLGAIYLATGECDKAVAPLRKALEISPEDGTAFANIVDAEICLDRLEDAKAVARDAASHDADTPRTHVSLYIISFLQHDAASMEKEAAYLVGLPEWNAFILCAEARTAAYAGQFGKARGLVRRSAAVALLGDQPETAANCHADAALWEALAGNATEARQQAQAALLFASSNDVLAGSAIALALTGDSALATRLAGELAKRSPQDMNVELHYLPTIRGAIALRSGNNAEALQMLPQAAIYNVPSLYPTYLRGEAHLATGQGAAAITEFRKILDRPGVVANNPIGALVQVEIGRAFEMTGEMGKAKVVYQEFMKLWKDADFDIPMMNQAKTEYERVR